MNALAARFTNWLGFGTGVCLEAKPLPEPEPINAVARPMTGFLATLTVEQRTRALAYRGPENHGNPEFAAKR